MTPQQATRKGLPDLSGYPPAMTKAQVASLFGRSVRWLDLQIAAGTFPIPRLTYMPVPHWSKSRVLAFFEAETTDRPVPRARIGRCIARPGARRESLM